LQLGGHVAFEIGDKVIYPNHGLGIIERVETKTIMGTTCGFYQLRMANETTVFVPVDNVDGVGLRRAIADVEVERLFGLLGDGEIESHQNWKGRFKDNSDRMRTGSIYDVVEVLKSLSHLSKSKSLSFREKRMLDRAKFLVISEISEVLGEKSPQVEGKVDKALEQCFVTKARNVTKAKAAGSPAVAPSLPTPTAAPTPAPAPPKVAARVPPPPPVRPAAPPPAARAAGASATPTRTVPPVTRVSAAAARAAEAKSRAAAASRVAPVVRARVTPAPASRSAANSRVAPRRAARAS
jgi:CarD family transcriptional regulator